MGATGVFNDDLPDTADIHFGYLIDNTAKMVLNQQLRSTAIISKNKSGFP